MSTFTPGPGAGSANISLNNISAGNAMNVDLNMNTHKIIGVVDPTAAQEAATKAYVDAQVVGAGANTSLTNLVSPVQPNQDIDMQGVQKVFNHIDPTNPQDVATKAYVDAQVSAGGANTALSNLIFPTAINLPLISGVGTTLTLRSADSAVADATPTSFVTLKSGDKTAGTGFSGGLFIESGSSVGGGSGQIDIKSGTGASTGAIVIQSSGSAGTTGGITINSGISSASASGVMNFTSGSVLGAGTSGFLNLTSGAGLAAGGNSGQITLKSGNAFNNSGGVIIGSGNHTGTTGTGSGVVNIATGDQTDGSGAFLSGNMTIETGSNSSSNGAANSGSITIQTGTVTGGTRGVINLIASAIDHLQTVSKRVVWENGATGSRPGGPVLGQRFFDTTLGIPIWFDGTNWVDATGATV